jgi:transcription antitermination factor NusG
MDAWATGVAPRLVSLGIRATIAGPPNEASSLPQVHFVVRGAPREATRLVLALDSARVRAGLEVPASQARTARVRLSDPARALELAKALEALPEQFTVGVLDDVASTEASRATADEVQALLDRIERERGTLWVGWSVPRELATPNAALLDELLADAIVALAKVFALVGGNVVDRHARREQDARGAKGHRLARRRGAVDRSLADDDERDRTHAGGTHAIGHDRDVEREAPSDRDAEPEALRDLLSRGRLDAKLPSRPGSRRRPPKTASDVIEKGTRVHVLKGPFAGKVGVVHELDGKGGARVMLGLLAVRLDVSNLVSAVEGRGRPRLSSSHRKPIPARS